MTTVGNYRLGGDQARSQLLQAGTEASKNLPPGWRVEAFSGQRGKGAAPHISGSAIDFRLIDPSGKEVANYQDPTTYSIYEKFAQDSHLALQKINPELARRHRWGGYFSGAIGPGGKYGAMDEMHQDLLGDRVGMAAGSWEKGIDPQWKKNWHVTDASQGIASRAKEREEQIAQTAKEEDRGGGTFASGDYKRVRTTIDSDSAMQKQMRKQGEAGLSGKLTAEVTAPPGTKVTVVGTKGFQKTETTRRFTGNAAKIVHPTEHKVPEMQHTAGGPT
jgi:hypothetical protein